MECKNQKYKKYSGKENTPLGKGYHAEGEKIDKKMKGKDNNYYKVINTKNGKRWQKIKNLKRNIRGGLQLSEDVISKAIQEGVLKQISNGNPKYLIGRIYIGRTLDNKKDFQPGEHIIFAILTPKNKESIICNYITLNSGDDSAMLMFKKEVYILEKKGDFNWIIKKPGE